MSASDFIEIISEYDCPLMPRKIALHKPSGRILAPLGSYLHLAQATPEEIRPLAVYEQTQSIMSAAWFPDGEDCLAGDAKGALIHLRASDTELVPRQRKDNVLNFACTGMPVNQNGMHGQKTRIPQIRIEVKKKGPEYTQGNATRRGRISQSP